MVRVHSNTVESVVSLAQYSGACPFCNYSADIETYDYEVNNVAVYKRCSKCYRSWIEIFDFVGVSYPVHDPHGDIDRWEDLE